jgi:putative ABC transport system permease protein
LRLELGPIIRSASRRRGALALVVMEFASGFTVISCLFLAGTWYWRMGDVHSGPHEPDLLEVFLQRPAPAVEEPVPGRTWQNTVASAITGTPRVVAAATLNASLLDDRMAQPSRVQVVGRAGGASGWTVRAGLDLPQVLGMRLVEGEYPHAGRPDSALISRGLAGELFPDGGSALGRRLTSGEIAGSTVVGVFEDLALRRPFVANTQNQAIIFSPLPDERRGRFLVRAEPGQRLVVADALRARLPALVGPAGLVEVKLYTAESSRQYRTTRGILLMLVLLAVNVSFVALLGPVAVSSFLVAERIRQIGVRRALGATRLDVVRYFLVENALAILLGTGLGAVLVVPFYLFMRPFFFGAELRPWMLILTAALLFVDGTLAALMPALRASRIAPSLAARSL